VLDSVLGPAKVVGTRGGIQPFARDNAQHRERPVVEERGLGIRMTSGSGKVTVVVGGQYGSESKGAVTAWLAEQIQGPLMAVRVAGPNAGHTAVGVLDDKAWALRAIPAVAVRNLQAGLVISAGSEVDPVVLADEIEQLEAAGYRVLDRLWVDPQATWLGPEFIEQEKQLGIQARIGSTSKGIGAARAARIMRTADLVGDRLADDERLGKMGQLRVEFDTAELLHQHLREGGDVLIEGTQGYGLGLHAGYYPQCTSSDCRAIDFLAMAGISPWATEVESVEPWVVCRTFPIRVAGNSGPLHEETTWEQLAEESGGYIQPERTTVTKKIRRVGRWDPHLVRRALAANGGPATTRLFLGFVDYIDPKMAGAKSPEQLTDRVREFIDQVEQQVGRRPDALGTGPASQIDLRGVAKVKD
jgi:adenylosuccinate synthase